MWENDKTCLWPVFFDFNVSLYIISIYYVFTHGTTSYFIIYNITYYLWILKSNIHFFWNFNNSVDVNIVLKKYENPHLENKLSYSSQYHIVIQFTFSLNQNLNKCVIAAWKRGEQWALTRLKKITLCIIFRECTRLLALNYRKLVAARDHIYEFTTTL